MLDSSFRRAEAAEAAGEYRRAAALYVQAGATEAAADALIYLARGEHELEARLAAFRDALRFLPPEHAMRGEVEREMGLAVLSEARAEGVAGPASARRLIGAAEHLERAAAYSDAATAWELLRRGDDVVRCLKLAGEIERLERFLDAAGGVESTERTLRAELRAHEMAMAVGARSEAWDALTQALRAAPDDPDVRDLVRRFERRRTATERLCIASGAERRWVIGKTIVSLGRAGADLCFRGPSVSRRHAELRIHDDGVYVRDLESRNGTLVAGVPIADPLRVEGPVEIGLGEDVSIRVAPDGCGRTIALEVVAGLDLGLRATVGSSPVRPPELGISVHFERGFARLLADVGEMRLNGQRCTAGVEVLRGDVVEVAGRRLEIVE